MEKRTFIGDWLENRPFGNKCVVNVATRASEGDEAAVLDLRRIEHDSGGAKVSPDNRSATIGCLSVGCSGCVKLIMVDAGVEAVDCAVQAVQPTDK